MHSLQNSGHFMQLLRKSNEMGLKKLLEREELQLYVKRTSMEGVDV